MDTRKIKEWIMEKKLDKGNHRLQLNKVVEEVGELAEAINKQKDNVTEEIGDIVISLITMCMQLEIELEDCVDGAYEKNINRKGKMYRGHYIKEEDIDPAWSFDQAKK